MRSVLRSPPPDVPPRARVESVPFVKQEENRCGPSTLAMVLQWAGQPASPDELAPEVYTEDRKGSLPMQLVSAARRRGFLAIPISGARSLLQEIAAGHPVIVFENLGFSWLPKWHFSVVVGYDLEEQEVIQHSGETAFHRLSLNQFERGWKLGDYWGLVVLPPGSLARSAGELEHLQASVGLEQAGRAAEAERVYRNVLKRWPKSLAALIGLGNLAYGRGNLVEAVGHLRRAVKLHPESLAARHNLGVAENAARRKGTRKAALEQPRVTARERYPQAQEEAEDRRGQ
jgi:predicted Zn-dependent protease